MIGGSNEIRMNGSFNGDGDYSYYALKRLDEDMILVNLIDNAYPMQFKDGLMNKVIDITVLLIGYCILEN